MSDDNFHDDLFGDDDDNPGEDMCGDLKKEEDSSEEVLSQDEISNLLKAVNRAPLEKSAQTEDSVETPSTQKAAYSGPPLKAYDFKRPERFAKKNVRGVLMVHEECARKWSNQMESRFSITPNFHVVSVDQLTFEEFIRSFTYETLFALCRFSAGGPEFIMEIDSRLIELLISRLAGSSRDQICENSSRKELTPLQKAVVPTLITSMLESVNAAWNHILPCEVILEKVFYNTMEINLFPAVEMIILATVEYQCGSEGYINVAYPFSSLENIRPLLTADRFISRRYGDKELSAKREEENSITFPESRYHLYYDYPLNGVTLRQFLDSAGTLELSLDPELKGKRLYKPVLEDYGR